MSLLDSFRQPLTPGRSVHIARAILPPVPAGEPGSLRAAGSPSETRRIHQARVDRLRARMASQSAAQAAAQADAAAAAAPAESANLIAQLDAWRALNSLPVRSGTSAALAAR